ncbi:MAG TPA: alpha/beta family hydrolase [Jatrophihabitans sp.]|jgi:predicted alpha/beta-hydrolase family hydrolase|nr:alpha/beta family hydrolase [Jatrophihabitans sp.]
MTTKLDIPTFAGPAHAEIDRPHSPPTALLVLTHGAGGGTNSHDLLAAGAAALQVGVAVVRLTQPYVVAGRRSPPVPEKQDEAWLAAVAALRRRRGFKELPLIVGGRSNGARVACRTATASGAVGVVALAFPVHPPGKPEASRLAELDAAGVPVLVVQGERDPFGMPPAGADRTVVVIDGADHSLKRGLATVASAVTEFVTTVAGRASVVS